MSLVFWKKVNPTNSNLESLPVTVTDPLPVTMMPGGNQQVYNATGATAIALSTTLTADGILDHVTIKFNTAPTTAGNITLTLNANDGAAYDTVLLTVDPSDGRTSIFWQPDEDLTLESGDELDLAYTNADGRTYGARIVVRGR